jgi:hypothetical protein
VVSLLSKSDGQEIGIAGVNEILRRQVLSRMPRED